MEPRKSTQQLVYRIEHPIDGIGMFRYRTQDGRHRHEDIKTVDRIANTINDNHTTMSTMTNDSYVGIPEDITFKHYFCAYKSLKHVKRFMNKRELTALLENGYNIYQLKLSRCYIGNDQIIYKKAAIVKKRNVNYLVKYFNNEDVL